MTDEYQMRQFFERKTKWISVKELWPNPKTYLYTGLVTTQINWTKTGGVWRYKEIIQPTKKDEKCMKDSGQNLT